jgi:DNA-binding GntR family transcriptional regulator
MSRAVIQPLERDDGFSHRIYAQLREALMRGRLHPGQRLVHRTLAAEFKVSPTPVREAVLRLAAESALIVDQRGVAFVPLLAPETYTEILSLRLDLEGQAAAAAARKPDTALADEFAAIHKRMQKARRAGDEDTLLAENENFHFRIIAAARMPVLADLVANLWVRCGPALRYNIPHEEVEPDHPHLDFIAAVRAGSARRGRESMVRDIEKGGAMILKALADIKAQDEAKTAKSTIKGPHQRRKASPA